MACKTSHPHIFYVLSQKRVPSLELALKLQELLGESTPPHIVELIERRALESSREQ